MSGNSLLFSVNVLFIASVFLVLACGGLYGVCLLCLLYCMFDCCCVCMCNKSIIIMLFHFYLCYWMQ